MLQYFAMRRHYAIAEDRIVYENPFTGVYFFIQLQCGRNIRFEKTVVSAEFEVNYFRPSYFGTEAEIELSAFMTAFQPRIEDPQIRGMGDGPYSGDGFLNGWNYGNAFTYRSILSKDPDLELVSMPADELRAIWEWNYKVAEQKQWVRYRSNVPKISFHVVEGRPCRVAIWPQGEAVLLPRVEHVLIGRIISGEVKFAFASWPEVLEVAARAGFDTTKDPLDLDYIVMPPPIAEWIATRPLLEQGAFERRDAYKILDEELIAAARAAVDRDQAER